jgi:hypothetical protein
LEGGIRNEVDKTSRQVIAMLHRDGRCPNTEVAR